MLAAAGVVCGMLHVQDNLSFLCNRSHPGCAEGVADHPHMQPFCSSCGADVMGCQLGKGAAQ